MENWEKRLITLGTSLVVEVESSSICDEVKELLDLTLSGEWVSVLTHSSLAGFIATPREGCGTPRGEGGGTPTEMDVTPEGGVPTTEESIAAVYKKWNTALQGYQDDNERCLLLCVGISCIQLFTEANCTGPALVESFPPFTVASLASTALSVDGEVVYKKLNNPDLLLLARYVFTKTTLNICKSWSIWMVRCLRLHQCILSDLSPTLQAELIDLLPLHTDLQTHINTSLPDVAQTLTAVMCIELSYLFTQYCMFKQAKTYLNNVYDILQISISLTGALGRRTYHQQKAVAQLTVSIERHTDTDTQELRDPYQTTNTVPKDLQLEDDVRMNKIKFEAERNIPQLSPVEQAAVLLTFVEKKKLQPQDNLQSEELLPYITLVLSSPLVWSLQFSALFYRCRIESNHRRTIERAMTQLQELVDSFTLGSPSGLVRSEMFYASFMPPHWEVQKELGKLLMLLNSHQAALDIFLQLQMWEDVILCYHVLRRRDKAEDVARALLEEEESAHHWCLLGDATDDPEAYHTAWEVSNHSSARAQRSLGDLAFNQQHYCESMVHYEKSLEVNTLQLRIWYHLGFAALSTEQWSTAARAYHRVTSIDTESFEGWNNLSKAYVKLGDKMKAFRTLQEAIKCNYEDWKIWDNLMVVSVDVGAFNQVIAAYHRILDLKGSHIDVEVLTIVSRAVIEGREDFEGQSAQQLTPHILKLLGRITAQSLSVADVWLLYADLLLHTETKSVSDAPGVSGSAPEQSATSPRAAINESSVQRAAQYYVNAHRAATNVPRWEKNLELTLKTLYTANQLTEGILRCYELLEKNEIRVQMLNSARLPLKSTITAVKKNQVSMTTDELPEEIQQPLAQLEEGLDKILQIINN